MITPDLTTQDVKWMHPLVCLITFYWLPAAMGRAITEFIWSHLLPAPMMTKNENQDWLTNWDQVHSMHRVISRRSTDAWILQEEKDGWICFFKGWCCFQHFSGTINYVYTVSVNIMAKVVNGKQQTINITIASTSVLHQPKMHECLAYIFFLFFFCIHNTVILFSVFSQNH